MKIHFLSLFIVLFTFNEVSASPIITFEDAIPGRLSPTFYEPVGVRILGASIFRTPIGSWASARSGFQGMYPSSPNSNDGTSYMSVLAAHGIQLSNVGGAISDVYFIDPANLQPVQINQFSIGYGYDSDGGESFQAVIIEAYDASNNKILDVVRPNLYYDAYESFTAMGAVRLRLTQNGYVGFDDLSFTTSVVPEPHSALIFIIGLSITCANIRLKRSKSAE